MALEIFDSGRKEFRTNREVFIRVDSIEGQMQAARTDWFGDPS